MSSSPSPTAPSPGPRYPLRYSRSLLTLSLGYRLTVVNMHGRTLVLIASVVLPTLAAPLSTGTVSYPVNGHQVSD